MFKLNDKIAIVTGATGGLGSDSARAYAEHGANVALFARNKERLESLASELNQTGRETLIVQCDITDEGQVEAGVRQVIEKFGKIDILLNNAGVAVTGGVHSLTQEEWQKSMDTNVKGMFLMSKYVIPQMIKNNYGKIVNISSVNARIADKSDEFIRHGYNA